MKIEKIVCPVLNLNRSASYTSGKNEVFVRFDDDEKKPIGVMCTFYDSKSKECRLKRGINEKDYPPKKALIYGLEEESEQSESEQDSKCTYSNWEAF